MKTINERWNEFAANVLPPDFDPIQRAMSKRMFFCGFAAAYDAITMDIAGLADEEAEAALVSISKQLNGFNEAIQLGAA